MSSGMVDPIPWATRVDGRDRIPDWVTATDFVRESSRASERLVLVPVGSLDPRTIRAVELALSIPARDRRGLHVVTDEHSTEQLARSSATRGWRLPLPFVEDEGGIAAAIARVVRFEHAAGFDDVVVVLGRLLVRGRVEQLVHDRTTDSISEALRSIPSTLTGLVEVPAGG